MTILKARHSIVQRQATATTEAYMNPSYPQGTNKVLKTDHSISLPKNSIQPMADQRASQLPPSPLLMSREGIQKRYENLQVVKDTCVILLPIIPKDREATTLPPKSIILG